MCKCTPEIRTPFCGKIGCEWPKPEERPQTPKLQMKGRDWTDLAGIQGELNGMAEGLEWNKTELQKLQIINVQGVIDGLREIAGKVEKIRKDYEPKF